MKRVSICALSALAGILTACDVRGDGPVSPVRPVTLAAPKLQRLYVGNSNAISVYDLPNRTPVREIPGVTAKAMACDASGNLYVADTVHDSVFVYAPGGSPLLYTITNGISVPEAIAFGPSGNVYVANYKGRNVTVYAPGSTTPLRTIPVPYGHPGALAFDAYGHLYVSAIAKWVYEFDSNGKTLHRMLQGLTGAFSVALDGLGYVYVVNNTYVSVFGPHGVNEIRELRDRVDLPSRIAFDRKTGTVLVANWTTSPLRSTVTSYVPGGKKLVQTIDRGVSDPLSLAFDAEGDLYVANHGSNSVSVYRPGSDVVVQTIVRGVHAPTAAAIGP